ncbi:MAG: hypothetical protein MJZ70_00745 [Bacteroidales bacterium]|nr:hypothetical protein [Bacteroidales bacterium]
MKKSILFLLTISTLIIFNSCGKDYDYRDKWVGEYEWVFEDEWRGSYFKMILPATVEKHGQDSVLIGITRVTDYEPLKTIVFYNYFQVLKDGTIRMPESYIGYQTCWAGRFESRDSFTLTAYGMLSGHDSSYTYVCKRIKK